MILTFIDVCYGSNLYVGILVLTGVFFGGGGVMVLTFLTRCRSFGSSKQAGQFSFTMGSRLVLAKSFVNDSLA